MICLVALEMFRRRSRAATDQPTVGIQLRGAFSLNAAAHKLLLEKRPKAAEGDLFVQIFFDRVTKVVAFQSVVAESDNAYVVRKQPNSASYILTGRGFTSYYGIDTSTTRRYRLRELPHGLAGFSLLDDEIGKDTSEPLPNALANAVAADEKPTHAQTHPGGVRLALHGPARKAFETLSEAKEIAGAELRKKLKVDDQALGVALLLLSVQLKKATGHKLDRFFLRKRMIRNGQRVKVYTRTKAGEKLIREMQIV